MEASTFEEMRAKFFRDRDEEREQFKRMHGGLSRPEVYFLQLNALERHAYTCLRQMIHDETVKGFERAVFLEKSGKPVESVLLMGEALVKHGGIPSMHRVAEAIRAYCTEQEWWIMSDARELEAAWDGIKDS